MNVNKYGSKSSSKKIILAIIAGLIVVGGLAAIFFMKNKSSSEMDKPSTSESAEESRSGENAADGKEDEDTEDVPGETSSVSGKEFDAVVPTIAPSKDYSNLYPELYVKRPKKQFSPDKTMFLTFDDGPSERTAEVLDILKEKNVKATFFAVGNATDHGKAMMKRIVEEGHAIAPHSYTHNFKQIYSSVEAFLSDFNKIYNLIHETTGVKPTFFRFAGGSKNSFNKGNYREIIAEMTRRGFDYFDWNLLTGDAARGGLVPAATCISNVTNTSAKYNNAVVLMHDSKPKTTTVEALPTLIDELKAQGFKFDKLSSNIYPAEHSLIKPYA